MGNDLRARAAPAVRAVWTAALVLASSASARPFVYGTWAWQVSADDGQTWHGGLVEGSPGQPMKVRALVGWDIVEGGPYAFAGSQFDVAIVGPPGNTDQAALSTEPGQGRISRGAGYTQTLVLSRFADTIKIDDARDTAPPGYGTRGVYPSQIIEMYAGTNFTSDNPVSIFEFTLTLDDTPGTRRLRDYFIAPAGGCYDRLMRLYVNFDGTQQETLWNGCGRIQIFNTPLELVVRCPADFDHNLRVDFFDYLDFIAAYAADEPTADFNGDQQIDMFDYLDFVVAFESQCE